LSGGRRFGRAAAHARFVIAREGETGEFARPHSPHEWSVGTGLRATRVAATHAPIREGAAFAHGRDAETP
jgi:hypothetical protein